MASTADLLGVSYSGRLFLFGPGTTVPSEDTGEGKLTEDFADGRRWGQLPGSFMLRGWILPK